LERRDWAVPETVTAAGEDMVPFMAGQALPWAIRESQ
ncbi:MAG TPA: dihydroorotase, partial [Alcanivorax sp.]|nr:dihydroorotase [Alcanivorax sp.]